MRVYYDRGVDTNLMKDPAKGWQFGIGAVCAIAAVAIWAGWLVMTRLAVTTTLTASDLTALRFAVAGVVLLPVVLRRGLAFNRLGWPGSVAVAVGAGAPVPLLVGTGLSFAPVAHASVLTQGILPLIVACLAAVGLKERLVPIRKAGLVLVGLGGLVIGGLGISSFGGRQSIGHLLFLSAACLLACYTVAIRHARLDGLHAAAIAAVVSLLVYFPFYLTFMNNGLLDARLTDLVCQALYQGVVMAAVSFALYGPVNHPVGCIERRSLYRSRAGHGGSNGDPSARRVAHLHRLACHRDDHGRRLSCQRRSSAGWTAKSRR